MIHQQSNRNKILDTLISMEKYTDEHARPNTKLKRELACLDLIFPNSLKNWQSGDRLVGRIQPPIVGFGSVSSVGGVGHYCNFGRLDELKQSAEEDLHQRFEALEDYWKKNDTREKFYQDNLEGNTIGPFVDVNYPAICTARLSGMYLDYQKLMALGLVGLKRLIEGSQQDQGSNDIHDSMLKSIRIVENVIDHYIAHCKALLAKVEIKEHDDLNNILSSLESIRTDKPKSFMDACQLSWLYSLCAGVVNYGRMDDYLSEYLASDLSTNALSEEQAIQIIQSYFNLIASRRTTFNSRVIIGGYGVKCEKAANTFARLAIEAARRNGDTEPQLTLRVCKNTPEDILDEAIKSIGMGLTYPILYNDDVLVNSISKAYDINESTAMQYVPLGCGEIVLSGQSVGTPNTCMNILKILNISMIGGIDPFDGIDKSCGLELKQPLDVTCFDDVLNNYFTLLETYIEKLARKHATSYQYMANDVGFLLTSVLTDDCIGRGKLLLEGGASILGGTNEVYGAINAYNALSAIKDVVFEQKQYTYPEVVHALENNFEQREDIYKALLRANKYGNDIAKVDDFVADLHKKVCQLVKHHGERVGLNKYLVVLINNHVNTDWGRTTSASADGRYSGDFMANGNNPTNGTDQNGPTAMLNSIAKLATDVHAGTVQNLKLNKSMFERSETIPKYLINAHFNDGGSQLMITVVSRKELEDAMVNPEKHKGLIVRVGGFSARFVELHPDIQREVMTRTLN